VFSSSGSGTLTRAASVRLVSSGSGTLTRGASVRLVAPHLELFFLKWGKSAEKKRLNSYNLFFKNPEETTSRLQINHLLTRNCQ
jgi:hypothetical protein